MNFNREIRSPNFDDQIINVEFLVLHYTALGLAETISHLCNPQSRVSAHIVIGEQGELFELVPCLDGSCRRAWHAGQSRLKSDSKEWNGFNNFSIGVELVNLNGNFFPYSEAQYETLFELLQSLQAQYPALRSPDRIVGHEQIAGFRGKCDPGRRFEWPRLFARCFPGQTTPERGFNLSRWDTCLGRQQLWLAQALWGNDWPARFNRQLELANTRNFKVASILLYLILLSLLIWYFS